jgi:hypothetical protein
MFIVDLNNYKVYKSQRDLNKEKPIKIVKGPNAPLVCFLSFNRCKTKQVYQLLLLATTRPKRNLMQWIANTTDEMGFML